LGVLSRSLLFLRGLIFTEILNGYSLLSEVFPLSIVSGVTTIFP